MDNYTLSNSDCMSPDVRQIAASLLSAKKQFTATGKNGKTPQYKYALLADIYAAVEPALHENNIIITHSSLVTKDSSEVLITRLVHVPSGQWMQDIRLLVSEKPGQQGKGAANTYMKKYAVLALCAIPAEEDDDGEDERKYIEKQPTLNPAQQRELFDLITEYSNSQELFQKLQVPLDKIPAHKFEGSIEFIKKYGKK